MQRSAVAFSKCRWEIFVCKQAQKLDLEQARRRGYVDANGSDTRSRCGPLRLVTDTKHQRRAKSAKDGENTALAVGEHENIFILAKLRSVAHASGTHIYHSARVWEICADAESARA